MSAVPAVSATHLPPAHLTAPALPPPAKVQQLHHFAYRAKDAEETRVFYEDILGLPMYHIIQSDTVPSTGGVLPLYTLFLSPARRQFYCVF
jgi:glyoxylase I family protein